MRSAMVRAPGGTYSQYDAFYFYYLDRAGYRVFDWNIDSRDSRRVNVPAEEIIGQIKQSPLSHEAIVLLHDGSGHEQTVQALPDIIRFYKEQGYQFASLHMDMKPMQFSIGKLKWQRETSFADFSAMMALLRNDAGVEETMAIERLAHQGYVSVQESTDALEHTVPPLVLKASEHEIVFGTEQYELQNGRFIVPLRQWIEKVGGRVEWDEQNQTATVYYGLQQIRYDLSAKSMSLKSPFRATKTIHLPDMKVTNGKLMVPLRATAELLGESISDYTVAEDKREVNLAIRGGHPMVWKFVPMLYASERGAESPFFNSRYSEIYMDKV